MILDAMKQALTALERGETQLRYEAITALRAAIEQAERPEKRRERVDHIRIRIMQEAYDLADRDDSEGYNSVKVMCSEVLGMIDRLLDEREWVGLTDDELNQITWGNDIYTILSLHEAKLKEKNT